MLGLMALTPSYSTAENAYWISARLLLQASYSCYVTGASIKNKKG